MRVYEDQILQITFEVTFKREHLGEPDSAVVIAKDPTGTEYRWSATMTKDGKRATVVAVTPKDTLSAGVWTFQPVFVYTDSEMPGTAARQRISERLR